MRNRIDELLERLSDFEQQMDNDTLPSSDQELLDQAWEDLNNQIACLQEAIEMGEDLGWDGSTSPQPGYVLYGDIYITQEEFDLIHAIEDDRVGADYYETDYGVYYDAADEV